MHDYTTNQQTNILEIISRQKIYVELFNRWQISLICSRNVKIVKQKVYFIVKTIQQLHYRLKNSIRLTQSAN